jgi:ribulose-phosphate 3-epimerase
MSINPGFGGQKLEDIVYNKITKLREMANQKKLNTLIEIDGGVNSENAQKLVQSGANVLVAGSYIFKSSNPASTINDLKRLTSSQIK